MITVEPIVLSYRKGRPELLNRQSVINSCAENLKRLWEQSFGTNFIKIQIKKTLDDYMKFMERHSKKSNRERTKLRRKENSTLFYCFTPFFNPADFDKYENYELENFMKIRLIKE